MKKTNTPHDALYVTLTEAFAFFNRHLFADKLPPVIITLVVKPKSKGYFIRDRFEHIEGAAPAAEIALNPSLFAERTVKESLSTLAHEMVHLWQATFGVNFPTRPYHNREWADKMLEIGLHPSDTGAPDGKETGAQITHYIEEGGKFDVLADKWLAMTGATLPYAALGGMITKKKAASKTKYTCPICQTNVWAKPDVHLVCADCDAEFLSEDGEGA